MHSKNVDKIGRVLVDSLLLLLLWGILALPVSSFSLLSVQESNDVLGEQEYREVPVNPADETKSYREVEVEFEEIIEIEDEEESTESTESSQE